jgi:hypothetical protein
MIRRTMYIVKMEQLFTFHLDITYHLLPLCDVYDLALLYSVSKCCVRLLDSEEVVKLLSSVHKTKGSWLSFPLFLSNWVNQHRILSSPLLREQLAEQAMIHDDPKMFRKVVTGDVSCLIGKLMFRGCHNILRDRVWGYDDMTVDPTAKTTIPDDPRFSRLWIKVAIYRLFYNNLLPPEHTITNVDYQLHISVCKVEKLLLQEAEAEEIVRVVNSNNIHHTRLVFHYDRVDVLQLMEVDRCWSSCICYYSSKTAKWCLDRGIIKLEYFYHKLIESVDTVRIITAPGVMDIDVGVLELVEELLTQSDIWNIANYMVERNNSLVLEWLLERMESSYHNTYQGKLLTVRKVFSKYKVVDKEPLRINEDMVVEEKEVPCSIC